MQKCCSVACYKTFPQEERKKKKQAFFILETETNGETHT